MLLCYPVLMGWRIAMCLVVVCCARCGDNVCGNDSESDKEFVLATMQAVYFWADKLPQVDLARFDTPDDLLDSLRYMPDLFDRGFSSISTVVAEQQFFGAGQFFGFGYDPQLGEDGRLRIAQVFAGPAREAGLERGFEILAIDGRTVADLIATRELGAILGPPERGVVRQFTVMNREGEQLEISMEKDVVTIDPVPVTVILNRQGDRPVGYVNLRTFISPSLPALDTAFAELLAADVRDVVLDFRYNGGGLVSVAQHLGNLLGGKIAEGEVFSETRFNPQNGISNTVTRFSNDRNRGLDLERLVFITSRETASASELVINAMFPHVEVKLVGQDTFGKPVGSNGFRFCDKILRPITFETVNSLGEGQYFSGLPATCAAQDDLGFVFGDPREESLAVALAYLETGACPSATSVAGSVGDAQIQRRAMSRQIRSSQPAFRYAGAQ